MQEHIISSYTRAQAIEDGTLCEVNKIARECGFRMPVALTFAAWEKYVAWSDADSEKQTPQDEQGRLWDILWMLFNTIKAMRSEAGSEIRFSFHVVLRDGRSSVPVQRQLKAICGPGDDGEPVITIMLPRED